MDTACTLTGDVVKLLPPTKAVSHGGFALLCIGYSKGDDQLSMPPVTTVHYSAQQDHVSMNTTKMRGCISKPKPKA